MELNSECGAKGKSLAPITGGGKDLGFGWGDELIAVPLKPGPAVSFSANSIDLRPPDARLIEGSDSTPENFGQELCTKADTKDWQPRCESCADEVPLMWQPPCHFLSRPWRTQDDNAIPSVNIGEPTIVTGRCRLLVWNDGDHFQIEPAPLERPFQVTETCAMVVAYHQQTTARFHDYQPYGNSGAGTVETMTRFREFCTISIDDPDSRRAKFARVNASLAGLIVATGGVAVARLVDGQVLAIMLLAVAVTAVGVAAMLGISYAVFRRGERDNTSEPTL